jgi:ABC-2 type transport system ATP-binding protein
MRLILGLDRPTSGRALINGRQLADHERPLREVGALLEARAIHTGRSARNHLRALAATERIGDDRVDEVLGVAGLTEVAHRRVGTFSLGMGQRLGVAAALLGDPQALILDEPINGLDPDGVRWIRTLLRHLADEGRTVFLSSHLMSEMALVADDVVVVGKGRLLRNATMQDLLEGSRRLVRVRSPQVRTLVDDLRADSVEVRVIADQTAEVEGLSSDDVGLRAARLGLPLLELTQLEASLEEVYMSLTGDHVEFGPTTRSSLEPAMLGQEAS